VILRVDTGRAGFLLYRSGQFRQVFSSQAGAVRRHQGHEFTICQPVDMRPSQTKARRMRRPVFFRVLTQTAIHTAYRTGSPLQGGGFYNPLKSIHGLEENPPGSLEGFQNFGPNGRIAGRIRKRAIQQVEARRPVAILDRRKCAAGLS
jgi:hypothetical protein